MDEAREAELLAIRLRDVARCIYIEAPEAVASDVEKVCLEAASLLTRLSAERQNGSLSPRDAPSDELPAILIAGRTLDQWRELLIGGTSRTEAAMAEMVAALSGHYR